MAGIRKSRWHLYIHLTWRVSKESRLIPTAMLESVEKFLYRKCMELRVQPLAVGVVENHAHCVVSLRPTHSVSDIVKRLKGASSRWLNQELTDDVPFRWRSGYWANTVDRGSLERVASYARNQREIHSRRGSRRPLDMDLEPDDDSRE